MYCEARKNSDLAWIDALGYKKVPLIELNNNLCNKNIIFNTIPSVILDEKKLKLIDKDSLIIELASSPGGVDKNAIKSLNINYELALALPGKVAPYSAAKVIYQTINNKIKS